MEWNLVSCSGYRYERQPFVYLTPPANLLQKHEKLGDEQITMALFQPWASARVSSYDPFFSTGYHHFHKQKSMATLQENMLNPNHKNVAVNKSLGPDPQPFSPTVSPK